MTLDIAGTMDGGRIRTLAAPFRDDPTSTAGRAALVSWCHANGLKPDWMLERLNIEIHNLDPEGLTGNRYVIYWREVLPQAPADRGREARTELRKSPLLVEPEGLLAGELTCGHVHTEPSPVADAEPLSFVCDQDIDPATGRHPGSHQGGRSINPATGRPADEGGTRYRMSWPNDHPGEQPFRAGLPDVAGLTPAAAHAAVLARLDAAADRRPRVDRSKALIAIGPHVAGLRRLAERHEPRATRDAGDVCSHDYVSATGLTAWPCAEVRDAFAGIVAFAAVVDR